LTILKELSAVAGNYDQSPHLVEKTKDGAVAKSGVGGTQIGWIRSKRRGQPDIPFGVISEGLNNYGNPKAATKWLGFMGQQNIAFKESNWLKRSKQSVNDMLRPGALYTPQAKISPRKISKQLMQKLHRLDEATLKKLALAEMNPEGVQKVFDRSERGFYLKEANPDKPLQNGKKLLTAPGTDGIMRTYTLAVNHNVGGHGDHPDITGAAKIIVSITPDAEPFELNPDNDNGKALARF